METVAGRNCALHECGGFCVPFCTPTGKCRKHILTNLLWHWQYVAVNVDGSKCLWYVPDTIVMPQSLISEKTIQILRGHLDDPQTREE